MISRGRFEIQPNSGQPYANLARDAPKSTDVADNARILALFKKTYGGETAASCYPTARLGTITAIGLYRGGRKSDSSRRVKKKRAASGGTSPIRALKTNLYIASRGNKNSAKSKGLSGLFRKTFISQFEPDA